MVILQFDEVRAVDCEDLKEGLSVLMLLIDYDVNVEKLFIDSLIFGNNVCHV